MRLLENNLWIADLDETGIAAVAGRGEGDDVLEISGGSAFPQDG